jgi:hypothetical protein
VYERATLGRATGVLTVFLAAIAFVVVTPAAASAHTISGPRPTNFRTTLTAVTPRVPGLTVRVVDLGNKLELTNRTATDVVVLGYDGEPYLRIGPRGIYENLRSGATYLNRTRNATGTVPKIALGTDASTPPRWHRISGGRTARWHDHRIHWMPTSLPGAVRRAPGSFHTVKSRWTVVLHAGARPVIVTGRLDWVPGPSGLPWIPLVIALGAAGFAAGYRRRAGAAIAAIVALVGIDAAHAITAELARPGSPGARIVQFLGDNFVSVIVWIAAIATIRGLRRGRVDARYGVVLVGAMVALVSGVSDLAYLWKSQLPSIGPDVWARAEVAAEIGLGFGLAGGALLALRRSVPHLAARDAHDPRWIERLVGDLDDDALAVGCSRLVADEVIPLALADLAVRAAPLAAMFGSDALAFVVLAEDQIGTHVWSITAGLHGLRVQRGTPAPARAEIRTTFPVFLQLLSGARAVESARAAGRLDLDGDADLVAAVAPFLGPDAAATAPVATV